LKKNIHIWIYDDNNKLLKLAKWKLRAQEVLAMLLKRQLTLRWMCGTAFLACCFFLAGPGLATAMVDLNTASPQELDTLKGIGPATAKKIIANRPYTSVDDLARAGLSTKEIETLKPLVTLSAVKKTAPGTVSEKPIKPVESGKLIDLNNASQQELETLPGIGKISAGKIIAGRPYASINDLTKAGIPEKNLDIIKPLVTINPPTKTAAAEVTQKQGKAAGPAKIIDLNTASQLELESLPGIGKFAAKKIIAARPYAAVDDLAKAGLTEKIIANLKPLATVSGVQSEAAAPATAPAGSPAPVAKKPETPAKAAAPEAKLAPGQTVNINTASKEMLETLPEIGPVKAQFIIDNRPYKKIEDIMKVKGIKEGTFGKIKDKITVN
jgi:competence protein ComEA